MLNISPMPDGRIEQRQIDRLKGMGAWLDRYGESIYGTQGGPIKPGSWIASTFKGRRVFVHLLSVPKDTLILPALSGRKVVKAALLGGATLACKKSGELLFIPLPAAGLDPNDAVIALDLDGDAAMIPPVDAPENRFTAAKVAKVTLKDPASPKFKGAGEQSLCDGVRGSVELNDEAWLGFEGNDCEAVVDLGRALPVSRITVGCLQAQGSWIFLPRAIEVSVSTNGTDYTAAGSGKYGEPVGDDVVLTKDMTIQCTPAVARFVKVRVANVGICPSWHKGAKGKAWVFVDEIQVQ